MGGEVRSTHIKMGFDGHAAARGLDSLNKKADDTKKNISGIGETAGKMGATFETQMQGLDKGFTLWEKNSGRFASSMERKQKRIELVQSQTALLEKEIGETGTALESATREFGANSEAAHRLQNQLMDLQIRQADYNRELSNLKGFDWNAFDRIENKFTSIGKTMSLAVTAPLVGIGTLGLRTFVELEDAWAGVEKVTSGTSEELEKIRRQMRELVTEGGVPLALTEMYGIAQAAGRLGIATDNVVQFSETAAMLGTVTNMSAEQAANDLAQFGNIMQMPQKKFDRLGATLVGLGNNMATTESDIIRMGLRLTGAGSAVGLAESEVLGFSAALSSLGVTAEAGGTAFSNVMMTMQDAVFGMGDELYMFSYVAGKSTSDFAELFERDAASALVYFTEGLGRMGYEGYNVNEVMADLGFSGANVSDVLRRAANSGDTLRTAINLGNKSWEENSALTDAAGKRYGTTAAQIQVFRNRLTILRDQIGSDLAPMFQRLIGLGDRFVSWLMNMNEGTRRTTIVILGIVAAIGPVLLAIGAGMKMFRRMRDTVLDLKRGFGLLKKAFAADGKIRLFFAKLGIGTKATKAQVKATALQTKAQRLQTKATARQAKVQAAQTKATILQTKAQALNTKAKLVNLGAMTKTKIALGLMKLRQWAFIAATKAMTAAQMLFNKALLLKKPLLLAKKGILALIGIFGKFGKAGAIFGKIGGMFAKVGGVFAKVGAAIGKVFAFIAKGAAVVGKIFLVIGKVIAGAAAVIKAPFILIGAAIAALVAVIVRNFDRIRNFFSNLWDRIKGIFSGIGNWFRNIFGRAADGIRSVWSGVSGFFGNVWDGIKGFFSNVGGWFRDRFTNARDLAQGAWEGVSGFFSNVWSGITGVFSRVGGWFRDRFREGREGVEGEFEGGRIRNFFSGVWGGIQGVFSGVGNWFRDRFRRGREETEAGYDGNAVTEFFSNTWSGIRNVFSNVGGWFRDRFRAGREAAEDEFEGGRVAEFFTGVWGGITNVFSGVGGWFRDRFREGREGTEEEFEPSKVSEFFSNTWSGIRGVFSSVGGWFRDRFREGREAAEDGFEGESKIGEFFTGVWGGITNVFSNVGGWFRDRFRQGREAAEDGFEGESSIGEFFTGVWGGIQGVFSGIGSWFGERFSGAAESMRGAFDGVGEFFGGIGEGISETFSNVIGTVGGAIGTAAQNVGSWVSDAASAVGDFFNGGDSNWWNPFSWGSGGSSNESIPGFYKGTNRTPDTFIAGERGPELITGAKGRKVFTAQETEKILESNTGVAGNAKHWAARPEREAFERVTPQGIKIQGSASSVSEYETKPIMPVLPDIGAGNKEVGANRDLGVHSHDVNIKADITRDEPKKTPAPKPVVGYKSRPQTGDTYNINKFDDGGKSAGFAGNIVIKPEVRIDKLIIGDAENLEPGKIARIKNELITTLKDIFGELWEEAFYALCLKFPNLTEA